MLQSGLTSADQQSSRPDSCARAQALRAVNRTAPRAKGAEKRGQTDRCREEDESRHRFKLTFFIITPLNGFFFFSEKVRPLRASIHPGTSSLSKTKHIPSHWGLTMHPN